MAKFKYLAKIPKPGGAYTYRYTRHAATPFTLASARIQRTWRQPGAAYGTVDRALSLAANGVTSFRGRFSYKFYPNPTSASLGRFRSLAARVKS